MRLGSRSGFGLILLVMLIAIAGIVLLASDRVLQQSMRQTQLRIDQTKAHYLAQAGAMRAAWKWYTNNDVAVTHEIARRWTPINTTVTGNNLFKVGSDSAGAYLQSNFAYVVPGIAFVKTVLTATNNTNNSIMTVTIPASTTIPVGDLVVIHFAMDGGGGAWVGGTGTSGVLDSVGNSYTRGPVVVGPGADSNVSVKTVIWYSVLTTALANPNTITIDWTTNTTAEAVTISHFSGVDTFDVSATGTNVQTAGPTNPPLTAAMAATFANELLVGAVGVEGTSTEVVTSGTNWISTPPTRIGIGSTTSGIVINPMYRIISATGNYTAGGTCSVNRDWSAAIAGFYALNRWTPIGATRKLSGWQIYNTHTTSNITLAQVKISWTPAGAELLNDFVLNGVSKWPGGTATSGTTVNITDTALAAGAAWQGSNTYIQWNASPNAGGAVTVTCQFIFAGDTATSDDRTHEVTMWSGAQANGVGMPGNRALTVTSTGQVNQTTSGAFKVLETIKAEVSGAPATAAAPAVPVIEITDWDEGEKNIP